MANLQQVVPPNSEELRNWSPSRHHIQDSRLDSYHITVPRHILHAEELQPDATAIRCSPCTHISSATFDTFRANSGQSLSSGSSQGEVGEKLHFQPQSTLSSLLSLPSQDRATAELISLLGDVNGKLRAGATVQSPDQNILSRLRVDPSIFSQTPINTTTLERARPRPRVELNLRLSGDAFVQGQSISGNLIVHVRDHSRKKLPVLLANTKLRVVGFEYLADSPTFHVFFHYSCPFNELSYASEQIFSESPDYADEEGYREAREGLHLLPFEMTVPVDSCFGKPKGVIDVPGGASVRYIIMASTNIKDSNTNQLSLAHFYRSCTIWPSLSLQEVLIPSTRPLVSTAVMSFSHGGSRSKLKLSARVPRPSYFSGQRCYVHIQIWNDTRKIVRSLRLTLIRTTTVYRPRSGSRSHQGEHSVDGHVSSTSYQAKAFVDEVSESRLVMAERTTRRCASSKGWWAGVNPHEKTAFTHRILIPPDALSIARSELLAVDHTIRVTVYASAGTLGLTSRLSVTLPIRIVSMLSVDPPTSVSRPHDILVSTHPKPFSGSASPLSPACTSVTNGLDLRQFSGPENRPDSPPPYRTRPPSLEHPLGITELLPQYHPTPCPQSAASNELQICEHEVPVMDVPPSRSPTTQHQWLPAHAIETQSTGVPQEERPLQHRATSAIRAFKYNREDRTSPDSQAGSNAVSESSISDGTRVSSSDQSSPGSCIVSPIPSLCHVRAGALTVANTSGFLCLEQTELRGGGRARNTSPDTPDVNVMDRESERSFRSHESPFTRRVKEKLRQAHGYNEELPSKPNQQSTELHTSTEDGWRSCELQMLEPLSRGQEQLETMGAPTRTASCVNGEVILRRAGPLNPRTNKPKLLMGPRKHKLPPAPGSVMDRVRILEGQDPSGQRN